GVSGAGARAAPCEGAGRLRWAMSEAPILEIDGLNAAYGLAQILFDLSLSVRRGEVVALMGRNGAGKSSTLKAVMGLLPPHPRGRYGIAPRGGARPALARPRHSGDGELPHRSAGAWIRARGEAHLH